MGVLVNKLPDFPNTQKSNYLLTYYKSGGYYILAYADNFHVSESNGKLFISSYDISEIYTLTNGSWGSASSSYVNYIYSDVSNFDFVRSSFPISYNGELLCNSSKSLSSSAVLADNFSGDNLQTVFNPVFSLIPVVLIVIIGCLAFRKGFSLLLNSFRGA